jgi:hypothetical protein
MKAPIATAIKPTADPAAMPPITPFDKPLDEGVFAPLVAEVVFTRAVPVSVVVAFVAFSEVDGVAVGVDPTSLSVPELNCQRVPRRFGGWATHTSLTRSVFRCECGL